MSWRELEPESYDPYGDMTTDEAAALYGITAQDISQWLREGLPASPSGQVNPFDLGNWLSHGRLEKSPALARRWNMYLRWFEPFVLGMPETRRITWFRHHTCFLPCSAAQMTWWLPSVGTDLRQVCGEDELEHCQWNEATGLWQYQRAETAAGIHELSGVARLRVSSIHADFFAECPEHSLVRSLAEAFLVNYSYGYRRHRRDGEGNLILHLNPGSCLDAAIAFKSICEKAGLSTALVGGLIAHSTLANPHFWLEVETQRGSMPVDITLPAIARMLGRDWTDWLSAYVGGCDARRITLSRGDAEIPQFRRSDCGLTTGELIVTDMHGTVYDAWPCLDWVCGLCSASFEHELQKR